MKNIILSIMHWHLLLNSVFTRSILYQATLLSLMIHYKSQTSKGLSKLTKAIVADDVNK